MPFIIALVGIIITAYFWANRARDAGNMARDIADMAGDVKLAARRFGFARRADVHPVESIEDPDIAAAAIADAFVSLDDLPSKDQQTHMMDQLRRVLNVDAATAQELLVLGTWLVNECGGPLQAVTRITKKLYRMEGSSALTPLEDILTGIKDADGSDLSLRQREALHEIKTILRSR
jgi:hypothetical protein